jgi:hypothetical protein
MSGNPPSIVLLSSSSSTTPNSSIQTVTAHPIVRPPIILQSSNSSSIPFKSVIVKPYRDSIQQALTTNVDIKPIVLQQSDNVEPHQPNKRIALDSTDLNSTNLTFSAVPKSEVMTALQPIQSSNTVSLSAMIPQPSSSSASFSTLRLVTPSTFINSSEISTLHSVQTTGQQILLQQRGNLVITQPLVTLQVQQDPNSAQKENNTNTTFFPNRTING